MNRRLFPRAAGNRIIACVTGLALLLCACASSKPNPASGSRAGKGLRVLDAVVVERIYEPPGSGGASMGSSGAYSLGFEAKDGEANVHYRFPVTRLQYNRYLEGTRVQLVMSDDQLREIRPEP